MPALPQPKESEAKSPTAFTGSDHTKLRDFLFECRLVFKAKPRTFVTDQTKINYAIQYLDGTAKRHFCRYIEDQSADPIINVWTKFTHELHTIFSDPDCTKRASRKLLNLKMKENGHVHNYTVQFKEAADEVGWSNDILQDLWAKNGPPPAFDNLIREAQNFDNRYWQRLDEKKQATAAASHISKVKTPSKSTSSASTSSNTQQTSQLKSTSSTSSRSNSSTPKSSTTMPKSKDLTSILGMDGKLLPEEKACRKRLGLCSYCGGNHEQCDCKLPGSSSKESTSSNKSSTLSKSTSNTASGSTPKGHVAQVVDPAADSPTGEPTASDF